MPTVQERFEIEMRSIPDRYKEVVGRKPGRFTQGINRSGAVGFAKKTDQKRKASGLRELLAHRRPEISVEYLAMTSSYSGLFTEAELDEASFRLENALQ